MSGPWQRYAQQWELLTPPLRPSPEDTSFAQAEVRPGRALILGATPELGRMHFPAGTALLAADRSLPMLRAVWPAPPGSLALQADWRSLPLRTGSIDFAAGDGCYSVLRFPDEYRQLSREVQRVLAPGAVFVMRFYASPAERETLQAVAQDRGSNFHALKWRLAMALQRSAGEGIRLDDIWRAWHSLGAASRFDPAIVQTIEAYRGSEARYSFPTLAELRALLAEEFVEEKLRTPAYEFGERFPTLSLRAK